MKRLIDDCKNIDFLATIFIYTFSLLAMMLHHNSTVARRVMMVRTECMRRRFTIKSAFLIS